MNKRLLLFIHCVYWIGIIIDLIEALTAAIGFYGAVYLGQADNAALLKGDGKIVLAWTLLLIWADRKPIERRAVLLFTAVIIILATISGYLLVISGLASFQTKMINTIGSPVLGIMYILAYLAADKMAKSDQ
jgi:hypothetical protein